jgi:hypothetical protein
MAPITKLLNLFLKLRALFTKFCREGIMNVVSICETSGFAFLIPNENIIAHVATPLAPATRSNLTRCVARARKKSHIVKGAIIRVPTYQRYAKVTVWYFFVFSRVPRRYTRICYSRTYISLLAITSKPSKVFKTANNFSCTM